MIESSYDVYTGLKLADFGSCRGIKSKKVGGPCSQHASPTQAPPAPPPRRRRCLPQPYTEYISTRWYRAPECLLTDGYYGAEMDIWGIGCVFFELSALFPLFPGENEKDQMSKIHKILGTPKDDALAFFKAHQSRHMSFSWPRQQGTGFRSLIPHVPDSFKDLLAGMLQYDPRKRISARDAVTHPYFADLWVTPMPPEVASAAPAPPGAPTGSSKTTPAAAGAAGGEGGAAGAKSSSDKVRPSATSDHSTAAARRLDTKSPASSVDTDLGGGDASPSPLPSPPPQEILSARSAGKAVSATSPAAGKAAASSGKAGSGQLRGSFGSGHAALPHKPPGAGMAYLGGGESGSSSTAGTSSGLGSHATTSTGRSKAGAAAPHPVSTLKPLGASGSTFASPANSTASYMSGVTSGSLAGAGKRSVGIKKVTHAARGRSGVTKLSGGSSQQADLAARHKQIMRRSRLGGAVSTKTHQLGLGHGVARLVPDTLGHSTSSKGGGAAMDGLRSLGASASSATVGGAATSGSRYSTGLAASKHHASVPSLGAGQVSLGTGGYGGGLHGSGPGSSSGLAGRSYLAGVTGHSTSLSSFPRSSGGPSSSGGGSYAAMGAARSSGGPKGFSSGAAAKYFGTHQPGGGSKGYVSSGYRRQAPKSSAGPGSHGHGSASKRTVKLGVGRMKSSGGASGRVYKASHLGGMSSKYRLR